MVRLKRLAFALVAFLAAAVPAAAETLLLEFSSPVCPHCVEMRPVVHDLAAAGFAVREVDVTREPGPATQYRIDSLPTFVVLVDGAERARLVGATSRQQLVEMIRKATAMGAQRSGAYAAPLALVGRRTVPNQDQPQTFAQGQGADRIVPIDEPPQPSNTRATAAGQPMAATPAGGEGPGVPTTALTGAALKLVAATVRLRVEDPSGASTGAGSIVDARHGEALVVTCGHLFRESQGKGAIQISLFTATPAGAHLQTTVAGRLIDYDLESDLALVSFRAAGPVAVAPIAPAGTQLSLGAPVTSVGCNHGENPTPWAVRLTAVNRYQGHPNVEAAGAPVEGRSGGGLFNDKGELIGVCYAADPQGNEGLYGSLPAIHAKLDSLGMSWVYQLPAAASPAGGVDQLASESSRPDAQAIAIRGQSPVPVAPEGFSNRDLTNPFSAPPNSKPPAREQSPAPAPAGLSAAEQAALQEIQRRSANAEVICIIRPQAPGGKSDVIKISNPSGAFVEALSAAARQGGDATASAASSFPGPGEGSVLK